MKLTQDEKTLLQVIVNSNFYKVEELRVRVNDRLDIWVNLKFDDRLDIWVNLKFEDAEILDTSHYIKYAFSDLEFDKWYTLEELGLWS